MSDREHLRRLGRDLIGSVLPSPKGIRLVGVTVSNFEAPVRDDGPALPLFGAGPDSRGASMMVEAR